MRYRLLISDMDGTLLQSGENGDCNGASHRLSDRTRRAIAAWREAGGLFTVATGRPPEGVLPFSDLFSEDTPLVCCNGSLLCRSGDHRPLYRLPLRPEDARAILRYGRQMGTTLCVWGEGVLYLSGDERRAQLYASYTPEVPCYPLTPDLDNEIAESGLLKILFYDDSARIADALAACSADPIGESDCCTSSPEYLEFMHRGATKGTGLLRLCDLLGIPPSQTVAVGDGGNDAPMLSAAGLGVAMGNADQLAIDAADCVTADNDHDGVAALIERLLCEQ